MGLNGQELCIHKAPVSTLYKGYNILFRFNVVIDVSAALGISWTIDFTPETKILQ